MTGRVLWLWRSRPQILNNPVISRELITRLRTTTSFLYLTSFLMLGVSLFCLSWFKLIHNRGIQIRNVFLDLIMFQGLTVTLFVPLVSATAINLERVRETWDLLRSSALNLPTIICGKFVSSVVFVWILLFSLYPLYGLILSMGGVSPKEVGFVFLMFTEIILITGLIGLFFSIYSKHAVTSIVLTYIFSIVYAYGIQWGTASIASPYTIAVLYFQNVLPSGIDLNLAYTHPYIAHTVMVSALIVCLSLLCVWQLNRSSERKRSVDFWKWFNRRFPTAPFEISIAHWYPPRSIPENMNPIYIKDLRDIYGRLKLFMSLGLLTLISIVLFLVSFIISQNELKDAFQFVLVWSVFLPFATVPYAVNSIRIEIDRNTIGLLTTTNITPLQIVIGKFLAGFHLIQLRLWAFLTLPFLFFFLAGHGLYDNRYGDLVYGSILIITVSSVFLLSLGIFCSSLFRKTIASYILTAGIGLTLHLVLPILDRQALMVTSYSSNRSLIHTLGGIVSPLYLIVNHGTQSYQWHGVTWWMTCLIQTTWMLIGSWCLALLTQRYIGRYND